MADGRFVRSQNEYVVLTAASIAAGEVWQLGDGRAAVYTGANAASSGVRVTEETTGKFTITKTTGVIILDGGRVYWDHSANSATFRKVNDRDFYIGRAVGDYASSDAVLVVDLNIDPPYDIDALRHGHLSVPVGTQAVGGFGFPKYLGGSLSIELTATSEAQKIDLLSVDGFAKGANAIIEAIFRIPDDGSNATQDFNIGIANETHATDADTIADSVFIHIDGASTALKAESDDGSTEVAATDTTTTYTEGSAVANRKEAWIDMRDPADVQIYVDGVLVLGSTVFNVDAFAGPWFLLAHLEKTTGTDVFRVVIDALRARFCEQHENGT